MSFWSKIGDVAKAVVTLVPKGVAAAAPAIAGAVKDKKGIGGILLAGAGAAGKQGISTAAGLVAKKENTTTANTVDPTQSVYLANNSSGSVISDIAKAIGLNVNLDANGKVTGSLSAGTSASPQANALESITTAIAKYWWILVIVLGAVLIFRKGRR